MNEQLIPGLKTQPALVRPSSNLAELASAINQEHQKCAQAAQTCLERARRAGELLAQAKKECGHGKWLPWVKANLKFGDRQAQKYLRVFREWENLPNANSNSDLSLDTGLKLLAGDREPGEDDGPEEAQPKA